MDLDKILELTDSAEILAAVEECRAAQRAADQTHRARINHEIAIGFADAVCQNQVPESCYDAVIKASNAIAEAIAAGEIRHLKIIY